MKKVIPINITGDRIRELRLRNHLTLDDVARHLGVGKQAIYKYEQGTVTNIPLENLEKMAELFGTTPEYLAGWSDNIRTFYREYLKMYCEDQVEQDLLRTYRSLSLHGKNLLMDRANELKILYGVNIETKLSEPSAKEDMYEP